MDALLIAASGIANVTRGIGVVSQNIANADTPNYVRQQHEQTAAYAGGMGMGVRALPPSRFVDRALQDRIATQSATTGFMKTQSDVIAQIDQLQGAPGAGADLASQIARLRDSFSTLLTDPSSVPQQQAVVDQASATARSIRDLAAAIGQQRQAVQDQLASDVGALNRSLALIGTLSRQIVQARASNQGTADLETQRDAAMADASQFLDLRFLERPDGNMTVITSSGLELPTSGGDGPLAISPAALGPSNYYPSGGTPPITLNGIDVTGQLDSGTIGAGLALRDTALPTYQAMLDEFSLTLAQRFSDQGLALFGTPSGTIPAPAATGPRQAPYVGFANEITVNPAVIANTALVRDGTHAVAGSPTGASAFTPNPPGGPAGFSDLIKRITSFAFGSEIQAGVPQSAASFAAMGPAGTLSAGILPPAAVGDLATAVISSISQAAAQAKSGAAAAADVSDALQQSFSQQSGVNLDSELSNLVELQNAYAANARVISVVQAAWAQLINAIP